MCAVGRMPERHRSSKIKSMEMRDRRCQVRSSRKPASPIVHVSRGLYYWGTFKLGLLSGGRNWWLWRRTATRTVLYTGAGSTHLWSIYRLMGSGVLKISPPRVKRRSKSALCSVQQTGKSPRSSIRVPAFYSVLGSIWLNLQVSRWGRANIQCDTRLTSN